MIAVADTSFVLACLNRRENRHQAALLAYSNCERIWLPQTALAETAYLLQLRIGSIAVAAFLDRLELDKISVIPLEIADLRLTTQILRTYSDSRIDFVDAAVMSVTVRLKIETVLTLDHRDFGIYRPEHCEYFKLLP
jgi:hypothetical protein